MHNFTRFGKNSACRPCYLCKSCIPECDDADVFYSITLSGFGNLIVDNTNTCVFPLDVEFEHYEFDMSVNNGVYLFKKRRPCCFADLYSVPIGTLSDFSYTSHCPDPIIPPFQFLSFSSGISFMAQYGNTFANISTNHPFLSQTIDVTYTRCNGDIANFPLSVGWSLRLYNLLDRIDCPNMDVDIIPCTGTTDVSYQLVIGSLPSMSFFSDCHTGYGIGTTTGTVRIERV